MGVLAGVTAPHAAAAPTSLTVWTGGRVPGSEAAGLHLRQDGTASLLRFELRGSGKVEVVKTFKPSAVQLAGLRKSAKGALTGERVAIRPYDDGFYATAVVKVGTQTRALMGNNALPPKLATLLESAFAAAPATAATARTRRALHEPLARAAQLTTPCPAGQKAVTFAREVSLKQAAQLGIAELEAKGGFAVDGMGVTAKFKDVPLPTVVRWNLEVVTSLPGVGAAELEQAVETELSGYTIKTGKLKGQPVRFDLNVKRRIAGFPPRPCFSQVYFDPDVHPHVERVSEPDFLGVARLSPDPGFWSHELLHLAGLDDRYDDYFLFDKGKKAVKLPEIGLEGEALAEALAKLGLKPDSGRMFSKPQPGWAGNLMAQIQGTITKQGRLFEIDLIRFAKLAQDKIVIHSEPGDLLVSKSVPGSPTGGPSGRQNLANGAPFDLVVERGKGPVTVDGMLVYCVDAFRGFPFIEESYDVLGPAAEQPDPAMQALARVLRVAALHQPAELEPTPGAQGAVFRVTDDKAPSRADELAILAEAGVPPDPATLQFNAPHYVNPNAGSPTTAAVTPTGVLPPLELAPPPPRLKRSRPRLRRVRVRPRRIRSERLTIVSARVTLARGAGDRLSLVLGRRAGRRYRRVLSIRRRVPDGQSLLNLVVRRPRPGSYRLRVKGSRGKARIARLRVVGRRS